MRFIARIALSLLGSVALCATASAITPGAVTTRYEEIPQRNVFDLKQAPPPPQPAVTQTPPPQLILTGITTMLGNKLALLKALLPAKPGEPAREQSLVLTEGQQEGNIKVLEVNEQAGSVRVNDYGTVMTLTFAKNGAKPLTTAAPTPNMPGSAAPAPSSPPPTPINIYAPPAGNPAGGLTPMPTRIPRTPNPPAPESAPGSPSPPGVMPSPAPTPAPQQPQTQLTPEEQAVLLQLEQALNKSNSAPAPAEGTSPLATNLPGRLPPGANTQRSVPPFLPQ
jgi:hypothetical protein